MVYGIGEHREGKALYYYFFHRITVLAHVQNRSHEGKKKSCHSRMSLSGIHIFKRNDRQGRGCRAETVPNLAEGLAVPHAADVADVQVVRGPGGSC